ncbi:MAG: hypothetical protein SGPRY_005409 [Prymnesium sp.]
MRASRVSLKPDEPKDHHTPPAHNQAERMRVLASEADGVRTIMEWEYDHAFGDSLAPSNKQLNYAQMLSQQADLEMPEEAKFDRRACENFIEEALSLRPPTQKQLALASRLAQETNVVLPREATESSAAIKRFIDMHKAQLPTEKQLAFANKLAERKGIELTETDTSSADAISRFIHEHKGDDMDHGTENRQTKPETPPTDKQLGYAQMLAERANLELPEEALRYSHACSNFIDEARAVIPPTQKQIHLANKLAKEKNIILPEAAIESTAAASTFINTKIGADADLPSEKQLALAISLARKHKQDLSHQVLSDKQACSSFIAEHIDYTSNIAYRSHRTGIDGHEGEDEGTREWLPASRPGYSDVEF